MQILKEEMRLNIRKAAIKIFREKNFKHANMRDIAKEAGMSVGNLYRYYDNKEALFCALVQPIASLLEKETIAYRKMDMVMMDVDLRDQRAIIDRFIEVHHGMRDELFLIFLRSEGSKYEDTKQGMAGFLELQMTRFLDQEIRPKTEIIRGTHYIKALAIGFAESFCYILENAETDEEFIVNVLEHHELMVKPIIKYMLDLRDEKITYRRVSNEEIRDIISSHSCHCTHSSTKGA